MPSPPNITNIPSNRVEIIDPRTGVISREWYRFFLNLFNLAGGGGNQTSLDDLQIGPPPQPDFGGGGGTVTSVDMTVPTGLSVSGNPITTAGTLAVTYSAGYSIPTNASQTNWDTAYSERLQWDGGATNLVAATGRTSLGATTVGGNFFTLLNPSAITFVQINADNTITTMDAPTFRTAIGAGTGSGSVTSVSGTGTVSGLTLTGTVTTSGSLTLGGTLAVTPSDFASQSANTFLAAPNGSAGVPTFRAIVAADVPTLNQNTTGTAANVTGVVAFANGGTGQTTRQDAMDALAGAVTSGQYLRGNGTDVVMSAIQAADVPTLNQNTTGSAATLTTGRTISISGDLTYTSPSFDGSANVTAAGTLATVNANVGSFTNASITVNGKGLITAASSGTAPVTSVTGTSPVVSSGGATPAISLASGYGDTQNPYASKTANFVLAAPDGSAGAPTFRAIVAADIPTLNQNTTGTAANVTGTVAIANGGTGQTTKIAAFDALSPLTTKGDLIGFDGTDNVRLGVGTNNQVLTADSTTATGLKWAAGGGSNITSLGLWENNATISTNYSITSGNNGLSAGPVTVASGVTVTVPTGSSWAVV
jgi:molybdopterin biosynthesis enzyme MoaB